MTDPTPRPELTAERARELLHYDPETGVLTWRITRGTARAGSVAGYLSAKGYLQVGIDGRLHYGHRLAWLLAYGAWPEHLVDHVNNDRADNRLRNLRAATNAENLQNRRGPQVNSRSGYIGAHWHKAAGRWHAAIKANGRSRSLGYYDTAEAAHAAYVEAKRALHPFGTL